MRCASPSAIMSDPGRPTSVPGLPSLALTSHGVVDAIGQTIPEFPGTSACAGDGLGGWGANAFGEPINWDATVG